MTVQEILDDFGVKLVTDVRTSLEQKQKEKASRYGSPYNSNSKLAASINFTIKNTSGSIVFEFKMADYFEFVDRGRGAGNVSKDGQSSIYKWIRNKGIDPRPIIQGMIDKQKMKNPPKKKRNVKRKAKKLTYDNARKQFTFLVSRKLKNKGYDGNFFYSEIILDGRLEKLQEDIKLAMNEEVEILIKDFKE